MGDAEHPGARQSPAGSAPLGRGGDGRTIRGARCQAAEPGRRVGPESEGFTYFHGQTAARRSRRVVGGALKGNVSSAGHARAHLQSVQRQSVRSDRETCEPTNRLGHLTTRNPCIPASRCPGTEQKSSYLPAPPTVREADALVPETAATPNPKAGIVMS